MNVKGLKFNVAHEYVFVYDVTIEPRDSSISLYIQMWVGTFKEGTLYVLEASNKDFKISNK